jgi:hypothetical protein
MKKPEIYIPEESLSEAANLLLNWTPANFVKT